MTDTFSVALELSREVSKPRSSIERNNEKIRNACFQSCWALMGTFLSYLRNCCVSVIKMADKAGYEPIPDVEKGEGGVPGKEETNYADLDLNDKETKLLLNLDSTITSATLDLSIPKVDSSQFASNGKSFIMGLVTPTLVAVSLFLVALYLEEKPEAENTEGKLAGFLVQYFPFVPAIAMFLSSVSPIQGRLMAAIEPVLAKIDARKDEVQKAVAKIGPDVDSIIVSLEMQVNEVLEAMKPTLKKAKKRSGETKKVDPSLLIPDVAEIYKEMGEAKGVVGPRVKETQKHLQFDPYIPRPFKSVRAFYWRIVFPIVLLALAIQLASATFSQYYSSVEAASNPGRALALEEVKDSINKFFLALRNYFNGFETSVDDSVSLMMSVVWSFMITFFELGAVFLLSNNRMKAWLSNKIMGKIEDETIRALREHGASSSFSDTLGTRMGRVRKKVLKVLKVYKHIESLVNRAIPGLGDAEAVDLKPKGTTPRVSDQKEPKSAGDKGKGKQGLFGRMRNIGKKDPGRLEV
jgi:hypothetical protein